MSLTDQLFLAILDTIGLIDILPGYQEEKVSFMRLQVSSRDQRFVRPRPLVLAVALGVMLAALGGLAMAPGAQVAYADAPSITIASPASASGPVQTGIRIAGAGWTPGDTIDLFYSKLNNNQPCGDSTNAQTLAQSQPIPGSPKTVDQDGTWILDFQWPATGTGQFYICGFDTNTSSPATPSGQAFNVLSTATPSITSINPQLPNVGDQVKISGAGFLPGNQTLDLKLASPTNPSQGTSLGTATTDSGGNFTQTVTFPLTLSGGLLLIASSHPSANGAPAPLIAEVDVTVGATPSTPTPTPTSSATPSPAATTPVATATGTTGTGSSESSSSGLIVGVLAVLLVLVLVAIFGVLAWYFAGIHPPAGGGSPGTRGGAPRARAPVAPRHEQQEGWQSLPDWGGEDDWEGQQGPWEEDDQGAWGPATAEWNQDAGRRPFQNQPNQSGPGFPPPQSGPQGREDGWPDDFQRPSSRRAPYRDGGQGRSRPGQGEW